MLKIHEGTTASGELSPVFLRVDDDGALTLVSDEETMALPAASLEHVMARFGQPLDTGERVTEVGSLDLGDGRAVRHVRHLGHYDVIARDYLIYIVPGQEPLCALATTVAGALDHLGRAVSERRQAL
jgi:hypothetical protein